MTWLGLSLMGVFGVFCRYWIGLMAPASAIAWGVLMVNTLGSTMGGVLLGSPYLSARLAGPWWTIIVVGFLGSLTTFSAVTMDTVRLFQQGFVGTALINVLLNNIIGIFSCFLGFKLGARFM